MITLFQTIEPLELLFIIGVAGTVLTFPLNDILSVGFYDITDFFLGILMTSLLVNALQKSDGWSFGLFASVFLVVSALIIAFKIFFVLPLLKRAENSTITSSKDLEGKEATVTVPIGQKTIGEIIVSTGFGKMNRMALIYACSDTADVLNIASGETVLIIEIRDNIAYVTPYKNAVHDLVDEPATWNQKKYKGGK
ncbi:NfeD family protein [Trichococcus sp. K1Tr]|uniref:NfeD family protein n=1 Tax=Trichococcus sp. K1Tr TaxID=3020847 RepID=UPI00232FD0CB|nr:NfeD family protein [Trichococcus sp. K1Tr]MDB6354244.1 NfeD family protein [Trichococcus sp. K1Tr]